MSLTIKITPQLVLTAKIQILHLIKATIITPEAICPTCSLSLSEDQINAGWRDDPMDYTTMCPACGARFVANLNLTDKQKGGSIGSVQYLCPGQLFAGLENVQRGKSRTLGPSFLQRKHPELFWNMIRHFGRYDLALKAFRSRSS